MSTFFLDLKHAFRMLAKRPGFTAVAIITLALGIGVNTILYSVVSVLALRPIAMKKPEQLVVCKTARVYGDFFTYGAFERIRSDNHFFSDVMALSKHSDCTLRLGNIARPGRKSFVSSNFFSVLGVSLAHGRSFLPTEETPGTATVGILSHWTWLRLGGDSEIVGKVIYVNGRPCRIVGIASQAFSGPTLIDNADIWLPLGACVNFRHPISLVLIGRLKPGMTLANAQAPFRAMAAPLMELFSSSMRQRNRNWLLQPLPRYCLGQADSFFKIPLVCSLIMGAGFAMLCITCLNLANLHIVQGQWRQKEIALRMALGGSYLRIVRQLLIEALCMALPGGILGLFLAYLGMTLLHSTVAPPAMLRCIHFHLDAPVFFVTFGLSLLATLLSGLWPALRLAKRDIMSDLMVLHSGLSRASVKAGHLTPSGFAVTGQITLSTILLMRAALFTRSAINARFLTPGYGFDGKLVADIDLRVPGHDKMMRRQLSQRLLEHMRTLPEIQSAALSNNLPFGFEGRGHHDVALLESGKSQANMDSQGQHIGGDYFQSMGMHLLQGRYFTVEEMTNQRAAAIVNESLARKLRPDGNVLDCILARKMQTEGKKIVGIVPDVRQSLFQAAQPHVYYPIDDPDVVCLLFRVVEGAEGNEEALLQRIRQEILAVNPNIAVKSVCALSERHRGGVAMWLLRMFSGISLFFGVTALFLATLGIYGVKGYRVATRIPEFGIRMALGATYKHIIVKVLREGWVLTGVGFVTGLACALALLHIFGKLVLQFVLCDVKPIDPLSIAATIILIGLASLLASFVPARRAAKVDPIEALRYE